MLLSFMPINMVKIKSDINLLMKYWWLKNTKISLAESHFLAITWEPDFSQACSFCRMLMNHKNFHFTQIPEKTNDVIFLKSPKTLFFGQFWPFLIIFAWSSSVTKNPALSHTTIYGSLTPWSVSEKADEAIPRKLMDRWKDR